MLTLCSIRYAVMVCQSLPDTTVVDIKSHANAGASVAPIDVPRNLPALAIHDPTSASIQPASETPAYSPDGLDSRGQRFSTTDTYNHSSLLSTSSRAPRDTPVQELSTRMFPSLPSPSPHHNDSTRAASEHSTTTNTAPTAALKSAAPSARAAAVPPVSLPQLALSAANGRNYSPRIGKLPPIHLPAAAPPASTASTLTPSPATPLIASSQPSTNTATTTASSTPYDLSTTTSPIPSTFSSRSFTPPPGFIKGGLPAPFPDDEDERVAALLSYRILDTAAEESFDHLAFLASQICQTPIALVSFVDTDRQWFKAKVGLTVSETGRDSAFCGYSILDVGNVFVVPDASADIRFADNPLVVGQPHIRFYAGAPIVSSDGHAFGSICAIDDKPRQMTAEQTKSLQILAAQCMTQLELKQRVTRLTDTLTQLQETKRQLRQSKEQAESAQRQAERAREQAERAKGEADRQRAIAEEARRDAEKANSAKSSFLANMSHEIRTPLNGVLGYASMLANSALSEEQLDYVNTITVSGEHLLYVLNDILDYSKAEASKLELEHAPVNVQAAVEQAIQLTYRADQHAELDLYYSIAADVPAVVHGDVTRLRQILANLISNALKFTCTAKTLAQHCTVPPATDASTARRKEVVVYVSRTEGSGVAGSEVVLQFSVRDTGIGIATSKLSQLFSAFTQVHTNKLYGGTGLGLVISQRLARLMGGEMWAESEEGQGSVFSFTVRTTVCESGERRDELLDALRTEPTAATNRPAAQQVVCSVLMVSDNDGMLAVFTQQMRLWGVTLLTATSTQAAVAVLRTIAAEGKRVSTTLIYHHGTVDVLETAQRIKELEASLPSAASTVPIIACLPPFTTLSFDSALCNRLCSASVRCPIILSSLRNALDNVLCSVRAERAADSTSTTPNGFSTARTLNTTAGAKSLSPPATPRNGAPHPSGGSPSGLSRPLMMANTSPAVQRAERTVRPATIKQLASQYPLDILIVEDNPVNMKLLRKMLANIGYDDCQQAGDGMQAVRLVEEDRQHYDIIFMDSIMPVMGGVDCTKRLLSFYRSLGSNVDEPIIIAMTASAMDEDKRECIGAGMREFVSKPVNAARLQDVITVWGKQILARRQANATNGTRS